MQVSLSLSKMSILDKLHSHLINKGGILSSKKKEEEEEEVGVTIVYSSYS